MGFKTRFNTAARVVASKAGKPNTAVYIATTGDIHETGSYYSHITYQAPANGFISVQGRAYSRSYSDVPNNGYLDITVGNFGASVSVSNDSDIYSSCRGRALIPVRRGDTVNLYVCSIRTLSLSFNFYYDTGWQK
jgi:hypothetical protein